MTRSLSILPEELPLVVEETTGIHIDIKDNKIWIQSDGTEVGVANELVEAGVPRQNIVLGFKSPFKRQFTRYAHR